MAPTSRRTQMYAIRCEVSGGITGYRTSWLKDNDKVRCFELLEEAVNTAEILNKNMNGPNATARFRYTAEKYNS
jgi:hypothetical protein